MSKFAAAVDKLIKDHGKPAKHWAEKAGLNAMAFSRVRKGQISDPEKLSAIVEALTVLEEDKAYLQSKLVEDYLDKLGGKSSELEIKVEDGSEVLMQDRINDLKNDGELFNSFIHLMERAKDRKETRSLIIALATECGLPHKKFKKLEY